MHQDNKSYCFKCKHNKEMCDYEQDESCFYATEYNRTKEKLKNKRSKIGGSK